MPMTTAQLKDKRVAVLCGGTSPERPGSLASGEAARQGLEDAGFKADLIDLAQAPAAGLAERFDVALLATHGLGGEDGKLQGTLDTIGLPYTGSGVLASATGMFKPRFKQLVAHHGIKTPRWILLDQEQPVASVLARIEEDLGYPVFFKPASGGGSLEAGVAFDAKAMRQLLESSRQHPYEAYMVEELFPGNPVTVGLLEIVGELTALPPLECETDRDFYDYEAKHDTGMRREYCPARADRGVIEAMQRTALTAHRSVGAHGVSRVDFMLTHDGRFTALEINTVPGLSAHGNLATMARSAGISYPELVTHILRTAFTKPAYLP
jgi:D-alanine-D-alanine ligase